LLHTATLANLTSQSGSRDRPNQLPDAETDSQTDKRGDSPATTVNFDEDWHEPPHLA